MSEYLRPTEFRLIEELAETLLAQFAEEFVEIRHPPIPVKMIAEKLLKLRCTTCKPGHLEGNAVGSLSLDERLILLDERLNPRERRFAIAHEIGHRVLHERYLDLSIDTAFRQILSSSTRAKNKKHAVQLRETEAKRFAGALLIPRSFLHSEARKYTIINAAAIRELARVFRTSEMTMLIRVEYLSENLAWQRPTIDWDSLDWRKDGWARLRKTDTQVGTGTPAARLDVRSKNGASTPASLSRPHIGSRQISLIGGNEVHSTPTYLLTRIRHKLRESDRPFVVEFAGMPKAGKNRQIDIIAGYLQDVHDYRVGVLDEAIASCPMLTSSELDRFCWTVPVVVSRLLEAVLDRPRKYDVVILNRGLFDTLAFLHSMRLREKINDDKESVLANFLLYEEWTCLIDAVVLLLISPGEALKRERKHARMAMRTLHQHYDDSRLPYQSVIRRKTLTQLSDAYRYVYTTYRGRFKAVHLLDFSESSPDVEDIAQELMRLIRPSLARQQPLPGLTQRTRTSKEPRPGFQLAFPELVQSG